MSGFGARGDFILASLMYLQGCVVLCTDGQGVKVLAISLDVIALGEREGSASPLAPEDNT